MGVFLSALLLMLLRPTLPQREKVSDKGVRLAGRSPRESRVLYPILV